MAFPAPTRLGNPATFKERPPLSEIAVCSPSMKVASCRSLPRPQASNATWLVVVKGSGALQGQSHPASSVVHRTEATRLSVQGRQVGGARSLWGHLSCWGPFSILWVKATLSGFPWRFSGCLPRGPALVSGIGGDCKPSSPCPGKRAVGFSWGWPSSVASLSPPRRYSPELLGAGRSVSGGRLALAAHAQTQGTARGAGGFELGGGHSVVVVSDQNLLGSFSSACVLTHIYFWSKCLRARCRENT